MVVEMSVPRRTSEFRGLQHSLLCSGLGCRNVKFGGKGLLCPHPPPNQLFPKSTQGCFSGENRKTLVALSFQAYAFFGAYAWDFFSAEREGRE